MTALITPAQLASRLKTPLASLDSGAAQLAVDTASGLVRAVATQTLSFVPQETIELPGGERTLRLPQRPVVVDDTNPLTIVEVGEFGGIDLVMVENRDYSRIGAELIRGYPWYWNTSQRLMGYPRFRPLGIWAPKLRVTYSHGWQVLPDEITSIVLDVACVLYDNPTGLRSISIDDYSETKAAEVLGPAMITAIGVKLAATGYRRRAFSVRT